MLIFGKKVRNQNDKRLIVSHFDALHTQTPRLSLPLLPLSISLLLFESNDNCFYFLKLTQKKWKIHNEFKSPSLNVKDALCVQNKDKFHCRLELRIEQ